MPIGLLAMGSPLVSSKRQEISPPSLSVVSSRKNSDKPLQLPFVLVDVVVVVVPGVVEVDVVVVVTGIVVVEVVVVTGVVVVEVVVVTGVVVVEVVVVVVGGVPVAVHVILKLE